MFVALRNRLGDPKLTELMDDGRSWDEDTSVAEALLV